MSLTAALPQAARTSERAARIPVFELPRIRYPGRMRTLTLLLCALLAAPALADDAEVETLIAKLGARKYSVREAASEALRARGAAIKAALFRHRNHATLEIRRRVLALIAELGLLTPEQEQRFKTLSGELLKAPSQGRVELVRAILSLGGGGRAHLERVLLRPERDLELTAKPARAWVHAGQPVFRNWQITVRNKGARPAFVPGLRVRSYRARRTPLVPARPKPDKVVGAQGGMAMSSRIQYSDPLRRATLLRPGQSMTVRGWGNTNKQAGRWSIWAPLFLEGRAPIDGQQIPFGVTKDGRPSKDRKLHEALVGCSAVVLPSWEKPAVVDGVTLTIEPAAERAAPGGELAATITLRNGGDKPVQLDRDWVRYTWIALAEKGGQHVRLLTAEKARPAGAPALPELKARAAMQLAPGAEQTCAVRLQLPEAAGSYTLAVGMENEPSDAGFLVGRLLGATHQITAATGK